MVPLIQASRLLHVFAARRSGQHAFIWWMRAQMRTPNERINNCGIPINPLRRRPEWLSEPALCQLRALFLNYEDRVPPDLSKSTSGSGQLTVNVAADVETFIVLLRDPYNNLASKRQANPERGIEEVKREATVWKALAREYLGETNLLPGRIPVNYNRWFTSAAYREQLSSLLRLDFSASSPNAQRALEEVPNVGRSQFDGRSFHSRAQQMDVLNRWRTKLTDLVYLELFRDEELLLLSRRIFEMHNVEREVEKAVLQHAGKTVI